MAKAIMLTILCIIKNFPQFFYIIYALNSMQDSQYYSQDH